MKKSNTNSRIAKIATASAFLALHAIPEASFAQKAKLRSDNLSQKSINRINANNLKFGNTKLAQQKLVVVAFLRGKPVIKLGTNELYQINTQTGDIKLVSPQEYNKLSYNEKMHPQHKVYSSKERPLKGEGDKISYKCSENSYYRKNQIELLGIDKDGHEIFQNNNKERFYFDPATGDMVDFNGHIALL